MTSLLELFIEVEDLLKLRLHFLARFLKLKNGQVLVLERHSSVLHFINVIPLIVTQDKRKSVKVKGKKRVKVKGKKRVKTNASAAIINANSLIVTQEEKNEKQSKNK